MSRNDRPLGFADPPPHVMTGPRKSAGVVSSRIILHLDMNSYFASVEQQANPHLRGRSVGVVATMTPHGCIIASSVEAKAKGIRTACRVMDAHRLDPDIILIPNDAAKYRSCTEGVLKILRQYTEDVEVYSIDEAFLNLTGFVHTLEEAAAIGTTIRQAIRAEVGDWLNCSIGVAHTRWLAKFAGDTASKGQTLVLDERNLAQHMSGRPVTDAWGIAHALQGRLYALGIYSLGELQTYPVMNLMESLGILGYQLWANLNGIELNTHRADRPPKSIGHSHVFAKKATSMTYPKAILAKLCEKAGRRMRQQELEASGVFLRYGLPDLGGYHRSGGGGGHQLPTPIYDTRDIFSHCWEILTERLPSDVFPSFLAMGLFDLQPRSNQLELWPRDKHQDSPALAVALDDINDTYGDFTVCRGSLWGLEERDAPDRVGFRQSVQFNAASGRYVW